ncbi:MAG: invasion associated locus B family protein [Alphaproteobacteria bacterium]|nr:invasion associated locus B family protein [Alphaproteobacteria bacterium]
MKYKIILGMWVITNIFLHAIQGYAQETDLGKFGNWQAVSFMENGKKGCFIHSDASKVEKTDPARNRVYLLVTHRPADNTFDTVSFVAGYSYKTGSEALIEIEKGEKFNFFTQEDKAWAKDSATDKKIVQAMKKASSLSITGTNDKNVKTKDSYSLNGFGKAYAAMSKACNVQP